MPEDGLELRKVGFREIGPCIHRAIVHAGDFEGQRVHLRGNQEICAKAAEFLSKPVAHIQRYAQRRRGYSHAEGQRRPGKELVARSASKRVGNDSQEHKMVGRARKGHELECRY